MRFLNKVIVKALRIILIRGLVPKRRNLFIFGSLNGQFKDNSAFLYKYCVAKRNDIVSVWLTEDENTLRKIRLLGGKAYHPHYSLKGLWFLLRASVAFVSFSIYDISFLLLFDRKIKIFYLTHGRGMRGGINKKDLMAYKKNDSFFVKTPFEFFSIETSEWKVKLISGRKYRIDRGHFNPVNITENIIVTGYPRNDVLFDRGDADSYWSKFMGEEYHEYFKILYTPTWRYWEPVRLFPFKDFSLAKFVDFCEKESIIFIIKLHDADILLYKYIHKLKWRIFNDIFYVRFVSEEDIPEVSYILPKVDCLITDYSTIWYDFLLLDKPIIFLPYDYGDYTARIDLLFDYNNVPGPKVYSAEDLFRWVKKVRSGNDTYRIQRQHMLLKIHKYRDANSSERIINIAKDIVGNS